MADLEKVDLNVKYKLLSKLGQGSYGVAFRACLRADRSKIVVIKRVSMANLLPHEAVDAVKEAKLLDILNHPNVLEHVEHFRDTEDHLCIVTKLADGGDIQAQVKKAAKTKTYLPEETIWSWLIQLCCAIKHVHDRKILHRDIKTANIFLQSDGDSNQYLVKLGDFGIAKVLEHTKDNCKTAVGTPYYMSPELCQNKEYNNKSDVWAIGCVLYELCTLKNPFDAHNFNALCVKILRGKYESIPPQYSSELSQVVRMCLEQQAKRRPDINQLLSLPQMKHRIDAYSKLSKSVIIEEFSHTALHGYNANREMLTPRGSRISSHAPPPRRPHPSASPRSRVTNTSAVVIEGRRNSRDPPRTAQELEEAIRSVREQTREILQTVEALTPRGSRMPPPSPRSVQQQQQQQHQHQRQHHTPTPAPIPYSPPREGNRFQMAGQTIPLEGASDFDTTCSRIESLRLYLEDKLTPPIFLQAYRIMCAVTEDDDERDLESNLCKVVGANRSEYLNTICQLIFCEDRTYDEEPDDDDVSLPSRAPPPSSRMPGPAPRPPPPSRVPVSGRDEVYRHY